MDNLDFAQSKNQAFIANKLGKEVWITVNQCKNIESENSEDTAYWCALAPIEYPIDKILSRYTWDVKRGAQRFSLWSNSDETHTYQAFLENGWEALIYWRRHPLNGNHWIEISDDFKLFYDLIPNRDHTVLSYFKEDGTFEEVIRFFKENIVVQVKCSYLRHYLMIRKMRLILFFEFDKHASKDNYSSFENRLVQEDNYCYEIHSSSWGHIKGKPYLSRIIGKKIIDPVERATLNIWHLGIHPPKTNYAEFIISQDKDGENISFSCNPNILTNNFGGNPDNPHYVTPVFFSKDVLVKYYQDPDKYEISDGYVSCQSAWNLRLDNHHKDYVVAYLGDLGCDLPESERAYWLSYNIPPEDRKISKTKFERDFLGSWSSSDFPIHQFKSDYEQLNEDFSKKYGWPLFKPLQNNDRHHFSALRIPLNDSYAELDSQILSLVRLLVDSINEKKLLEWIPEKKNEIFRDEKSAKSDELVKGGINRLKQVLLFFQLPDVVENLKLLRDLQDIRSQSGAHRKSESGFPKLMLKINPDNLPLPDLFESYLKHSISFLQFIRQYLIDETPAVLAHLKGGTK